MQAAQELPEGIAYGDGDPEVIWAPLSDPQEAFLRATEFECLYGGAKGGAKTESLLIAATAQVSKPKYKALLLRNTYPELQEMLDRGEKFYPALGGRWRAGEMRWVFPGGASIEFGYCETPQHAKRYQGREFPFIGYDEIGNLSDERAWDILTAECRTSDPTIVRMMRATANPGGVGHVWLKRRFIEPCGKRGGVWSNPQTGLARRFIPAKVTDNPIYRDDAQYMAQLKDLPPVLQRQLLHGDWDSSEGQAFQEWRPELHVVDFRVPRDWRWVGGLDWGYAAPGCLVLVAIGPEDRLHIAHEMTFRQVSPYDAGYQAGLLIRDNAYPVEWIAGDEQMWAVTDGGPTYAEEFQRGLADLLQRQPVTLIAAPKGRGSRVAGKMLIHQALKWTAQPDGTVPMWGRPRLTVAPSCPYLVRTIPELQIDPDHPEDVDTDGDDHGYDALRYLLMARVPRANAPKRDVPQDIHPGFADGGRRRPRRETPEWEAEEYLRAIAKQGQPFGGRYGGRQIV